LPPAAETAVALFCELRVARFHEPRGNYRRVNELRDSGAFRRGFVLETGIC
jgi:hypothetical protein